MKHGSWESPRSMWGQVWCHMPLMPALKGQWHVDLCSLKPGWSIQPVGSRLATWWMPVSNISKVSEAALSQHLAKYLVLNVTSPSTLGASHSILYKTFSVRVSHVLWTPEAVLVSHTNLSFPFLKKSIQMPQPRTWPNCIFEFVSSPSSSLFWASSAVSQGSQLLFDFFPRLTMHLLSLLWF